jgi:hypothetical protein
MERRSIAASRTMPGGGIPIAYRFRKCAAKSMGRPHRRLDRAGPPDGPPVPGGGRLTPFRLEQQDLARFARGFCRDLFHLQHLRHAICGCQIAEANAGVPHPLPLVPAL